MSDLFNRQAVARLESQVNQLNDERLHMAREIAHLQKMIYELQVRLCHGLIEAHALMKPPMG